MRLPRDPELPAGLKTLSRLQFIHGFVVVAVATAIWLPSPTVAQSWVTLVALLAALHLLLQVGLYTGSARMPAWYRWRRCCWWPPVPRRFCRPGRPRR